MKYTRFLWILTLLHAINTILMLVLVYHNMMILATVSLVVSIIMVGILIYQEEDHH